MNFFKAPPKQLARWLMLFSLAVGGLTSAHAEETPMPFVWAPDINVGESFPEFTLSDQQGNKQTNGTIAGVNGYLIQFHRSVVW